MEEGRPSWTAEGIARMRALHLLLDDDPKIFEDNLALPFLGSEETIRLKTNLDAHQTSELRSLRAVFVMRHRYAEDELGEAFQHGISQYVILGAGLDPFAYQCPDAMQRLHIYEVDHPPTQQWKRQRLEGLRIPIPANLTFIPIDFEVQTLAEGMAASDFKHKEPAFFSWLGVTQYLTEEAVLETLKYVSTHAAPGSEIVFQIVLPQSILSADDQAVVTTAIERASQHGEPWLSFFEFRSGLGGSSDAATNYFICAAAFSPPPDLFLQGEYLDGLLATPRARWPGPFHSTRSPSGIALGIARPAPGCGSWRQYWDVFPLTLPG